MILQCTTISQPHNCSASCPHDISQAVFPPKSINRKIAAIASRTMDLSKSCGPVPKQSCQHADFSVAQFLRFLRHIKLKKLLSKIKDPRQQKKIDYPNDVILHWALTVYFFRQGSCNGLQTTLQKLRPEQRAAILNYLGLKDEPEQIAGHSVVVPFSEHLLERDQPGGPLLDQALKDGKKSYPHRTVVNDCLAGIEADEVNELLIHLFNWAKKNKVFYNHMATLLPYEMFHVCCDGVSVHKYTKPHAVNDKGENICPYCLPRTRNKGKENEVTYWVHGFVNVAIVFPGGLQLPLYVYPLKASQIRLEASASDDELKQECELQAAKIILPILKEKLGKLPVCLLTDSLYANEPIIKLCEDLGWNYLIVRQEGSLKTVGRKCDELEGSELYQQSYQAHETIKLKNGGTVERTVKWFNRVTVGKESYTNVLRLEEVVKDAEGNIVKKKYFKTEWLCSIHIHKGNCFALVKRGRMRADHEDLHNTLKNRGYAAKHDYARANPNAWLIWKILMFVAFWVFELFSFTTLAQKSKGPSSWMAFARELFSELLKVPWQMIALSPTLKKEKIQFRFNFSP
jgi:hypothetical protein